MKNVATDFYHAQILFCKGKALKVVLTNKEGERFDGMTCCSSEVLRTVNVQSGHE